MNQNPSHRRQSASDTNLRKPRTLNSATCILSSLGIALLGLGVGAITAPYLQSSAALIALIGLAIHLIALIHVARDKQHALSTGRFWLTAIYASGWIILLVLVFALLRMWLVTP